MTRMPNEDERMLKEIKQIPILSTSILFYNPYCHGLFCCLDLSHSKGLHVRYEAFSSVLHGST